MFESKYSKVLTIILVIIIVAIVLLLGFLTFDYIRKFSITKQASDFVDTYQGDISTDDNSNNNVVEPSDNENILIDANEIETSTGSNNGSTSSTKKKYKNFTVGGTLKIPSLNISYPIFDEITTSALENGLILLYPTSDNLNQPGNVVIAGHNYRNGMFFSNLKKITNGAKISITDYRGKTLTYEVYNVFEANSGDTTFYTRDTNGIAEITLSTCTDASNELRTIVFAKQI